MTFISIALCARLLQRTKNPREQKQMILLITTTSVSIILGAAINVILPMQHIYIIPQVADVVILVWASVLSWPSPNMDYSV